MKRRDFIVSAGIGLAGTSMPGYASKNSVNEASVEAGVTVNCDKPIQDTRGFAFFGEPGKKKPQKHYSKYQTARATDIDYGLTGSQEERAKALHESLFVFDAEFGSIYYDGLHHNMLSGNSAGVGGSTTLGKGFELINGIEDKENVEITRRDWGSLESLDRDFAFLERMQARHGDRMMICKNYSDLMTSKEQGKIAYMLDVQNSDFFGNDLNLLDHYYAKGLRRVQLSYNRQVAVASGCMEKRDAGVSIFGADMISRLNKLNMLVDTGHCSSLTLSDAIDISDHPICCSHAGLRSMVPTNPRSHTDEGLKKLADHGGVFGVVGVPGTLTGSSEASVKEFVNAIDRAVNLMGVDHVGFALDQIQGLSFTEFATHPDWSAEAIASVNVTTWPWSDAFKGMENHSGYPNLTRGLVAKGYSDEDIRKVMGGNHIRLVREVIG